MFIFYDFETSSKDPLGQILNYYFVLTDASWNKYQELEGWIQLNSIQLPDIDAILATKLNIDWINQQGQTESDAAKDIYNFLTNILKKYPDTTLVGFNSNNFDLNFLRGLLLRYGYNPYLKFKNKDVLHFLQYLAFYNEHSFPWIKKTENLSSYYSFKLEEMTMIFGVLKDKQTHTAKEDVLLLITFVQMLEHHFKLKLSQFNPFYTKTQDGICRAFGQQRYKSDEEKWAYKKWGSLNYNAGLWIYLNDYENINELTDENLLRCIYYKNPNKAFFILEETENLSLKKIYESTKHIPFFQNLEKNPRDYFALTRKNWDIEYQIHELGFDRLDQLIPMIQDLYIHPELWEEKVHTLMNRYKKTRHIKDKYFLQLYNRSYLNITGSTDHAFSYIKPRYITGDMYKNKEEFQPFNIQLEKINQLDANEPFIAALQNYYTSFANQWGLTSR